MSYTEKTLQERVEIALDEIRPFLQSDGGDIVLESIESEVVKVRLVGNCLSCAISQVTLKSGVEMTIKKHAPEIKEVINIQ